MATTNPTIAAAVFDLWRMTKFHLELRTINELCLNCIYFVCITVQQEHYCEDRHLHRRLKLFLMVKS